jgi:methyl-accepting chemotaxis protein
MAKTWTFGQKLGAGFGLVVILTLVTATVGLYALRAVVQAKDEVIRHSGQDLIDAERIRAAMQREVANAYGFLLTGEQRFITGQREANASFASALEAIKGRGTSTEGQNLLAAIENTEAEHQAEIDQIIEQRRPQQQVATLLVGFDQRVLPAFDVFADNVRDFVSLSERERDTGMEAASRLASNAMSILVAVGIGTLLLAVAIAMLLTRALSRQIGSSVQHIRSSSAELQAAATQQATGAKEQATAMNEITTTIGELLATSRQIAESGRHVAKMAADSAQSSRTGEESVDRARDAVGNIKQQVDTIVEHMLDLGKKSQQIGGILEIINELAEQTNILAINATIEAAGAGESGRRFAVVGEEIRKLADRVGGSTKEIRSLIEEIRAAVNASVMATETGSKTVATGTERFQELQLVFSRIGELVASTTEAGKEIELSTKQQSTAVEQVNVAISNVAQTTKETEASSEQTLQTVSQLTSLSDDLARLVQAARA